MNRKFLKKGQNWSLDLILGIVVFMLILSIFYLILTGNKGSDIKTLKSKSNTVLSKLTSKSSDYSFSILSDDKINESNLKNLYLNGDYAALKKELGLTGDFCIVLEDANGNLVLINNTGSTYIYGFGNDSLTVGGCPCGTACT